MASFEEVISSGDPEVFKKRRSTIQGMMTNICKRLGNQLAKISGKFRQGKLPRLQVQSEHGSLKFQEEGEIVYEAFHFDGMDDEIEEESPEFPEQEKLNNEAVGSGQV